METFVFFIFLAGIVGTFGGMLIGKVAVQGRTRPAMALWLAIPFVLLAIVLLREGDPAMNGADAVRNAPFAMLLYSFFFGGPWAIGSFAGLAAGRALRGGAG